MHAWFPVVECLRALEMAETWVAGRRGSSSNGPARSGAMTGRILARMCREEGEGVITADISLGSLTDEPETRVISHPRPLPRLRRSHHGDVGADGLDTSRDSRGRCGNGGRNRDQGSVPYGR